MTVTIGAVKERFSRAKVFERDRNRKFNEKKDEIPGPYTFHPDFPHNFNLSWIFFLRPCKLPQSRYNSQNAISLEIDLFNRIYLWRSALFSSVSILIVIGFAI